jgi:hypothetical protein
MTQKTVCIIAGQRAGTNALQRAIEATGGVVNFGEIFHTQPLGLPGPSRIFRDFARENSIGIADTMEWPGAVAVAKKYMAWLKAAAQPKHVLIDVKFNSWTTFTPTWRYASDEPFFMRYLKNQEKTTFVLIWRESLVDQVLSDFISNEIKVWHNLNADHIAGKKIEAPLDRINRLATLICRTEMEMREHLQDYQDKIIIKYEDLFHDGILTPGFKAEFKKRMGLDFPDGALGFIRPNTADKREIVTNYDEILATVTEITSKYRNPARSPIA